MHTPLPDDKACALQKIPRSFFLQDADVVARTLLNCIVFTCTDDGTRVGGRIVETESYTQDDEASHSYKGQTQGQTQSKTQRCRVMFMAGGTAYVHMIYGMYYCCNIVTGEAGIGNAVLLRALQPLWGVDVMAKRRAHGRNRMHNAKARSGAEHARTALCRGPGCMSIALGISTVEHNETRIISDKNVQSGRIHLMKLPKSMHVHSKDVITTTRIGITKKLPHAVKKESRFYIKDNLYVSYPLKREM